MPSRQETNQTIKKAYLDRLIAENDFLRNKTSKLETELNKTIELLHTWKNNAYAYRLKAQMVLFNQSEKEPESKP